MSKLDAHAHQILQMAGEGVKWTEIARRLAEVGTQTTGRSVSLWVARRANRIRSRQLILDPLAAATKNASQPQPLTKSTPTNQSNPPAGTAPKVGTQRHGAEDVPTVSMPHKPVVPVDLTDLVNQPDRPGLLRKP